jgi:hypothetical protein
MPGKNTDVNTMMDTLYTSCMSGQRIYYPYSTMFTDSRTGQKTATAFKIKQLVPYALLHDIAKIDGTSDNAPMQHKTAVMTKFCEDVTKQSFDNRFRPLSASILNHWLASPFEEWLEETCTEHWFDAEWFQEPQSKSWDDFAILIKVNVPILGEVADFEQGYGESFVMTKMMYEIN